MFKKLVKKIWKRCRGFIFGVISTLFVLWAQEKIRLSLESAEVSINPQGIAFLKDQSNSWQLTFYVRVSNSGRTASAMEYKNFKLYFPKLSARHFVFDVKRSLNLSPTTTIDDTITTKFHKVFDKVSELSDFPVFARGQIELRSPKGDLLARAKFDSTDIDQTLKIQSEAIPEAKELKGVVYDSTKEQLKWPVRLYPVSYKGKVYNNYVYPPTTEVDYEIVDDRIRVKLSQSTNSLPGKFSFATDPIQFFPDPAIIDKIDYPRYWYVDIMREVREKETITHDYFKLFIGNQREFKQQIIYLFK
ncbi:MAG: hypothetical protein ACE5HI_16560 [bacterium]